MCLTASCCLINNYLQYLCSRYDNDNCWWPWTDTGESLPHNTRSQHICWLSAASSAASTHVESMSPPLVVPPHYVAHVALFAAAIASCLVLNTCCCRLVSTLDLSKCNRLTWVLDRCISQYVYISIVDDYPSPSTRKLEHLDFECIVWVLGLHFRLTHSDLFFASFVAASILTPTLCIHMCAWGVCAVSEVVWVVWVLSCSLIGKFSSFFFLQCLLTIYNMFSVISAPISMLGMTLFPLNTFACPHSPQHCILHPQYADNMCPHHCFSAVWCLWSVCQLSLEWSALPFDPSIPFPGPSMAPARSLMPPRHTCMLVSLTWVLTAAL